MSNSVFTDFTTQKNDNSLVIVMNKDGSVVSVDPTALRSYLKNESGNTSVSVVRVTSPTPSLKEELEKELQEKAGDDDMDIEATRNDVDEEAPHVRVTVEDYYPPDEAKKLASEILQYAGMTSHLLLDIDNEERVKSIHNDHCYTPLTSPSQRHPASRSQTPPPVVQPAKKAEKTATESVESQPSKEESEEEKSDAGSEATESESEFSVSESENDRDSDLDYTVNDRVSRRVTKKNRKQVKVGLNTRNRVSKKRQSVSVDEEEEDEVRTEGGKRKAKSKVVKISPVKVKKKEEVLPVKEETTVVKTVVAESKVSPQAAAQAVKKEKKAPAHVEALFSDMTSLFSAPDIIKKVGSEGVTKAEPPPLVYTTKTYTQKKETTTGLEDRDQLELIDSIVKQELEQQQIDNSSQQMAEDIPSIVKMLENPETTIDPELLNDVIGLNTTQVATSSATTQSTATTDLDLLAGLTSEDGLPEDLLQHVAELVENKNLQEVIDKQVLGVQTSLSSSSQVSTVSTPPATSTPKTEERESPFVKLAKQKQMAKEAAASIMSMNRKEPITIVRSDGRVITLPPIEAPTTRGAKRRAQSSASTPNTSVASSPTSTPQPKSRDDSLPSMKKIMSKVDKEGKSGSRRTSATPSVAESEENMDSDASWNSEDDPDRLWCICKQPHNNRFMICCDSCEDWFHGKCVNITKAMGQQMEEQGIEWRCPNCLKKGGGPAKKGTSDDGSAVQSPSSSSGGLLSCIVCKKTARLNSIYCSDDCIRKHAMVTTKSTSKETPGKGTPQATKKVGVLKNKFDRVIVYNKVTGKCLSGESAPTLTNLKHWLSENPNYEVVQPGSALGQAFKAKQAQLASISKQMALKRQQQMEKEKESQGKEKVQTQLKVTQKGQVVVMHPSGKASPKTVKTPQASTSSSSGQKSTSKQQSLPVAKPKKSPSGDSGKSSSRGEPEPIRVNVRRTLKEQLLARIADTADVQGKLTAAEVAKFATDVEYEMFMLFSKDTGTKYRAKYRSLMFNIKDRKNMSLLEKICEKYISPSQLVRMAPEELASQELAQWRENENKHQLEMIKKSELDLLACAKNYVLKTHKGEEVIESRISERVTLDPSIAVEDVVSVLNNSTVTSSSEQEAAKEKSSTKDKIKDGVSSSKSHMKKKDRDRRSRSRDRHDSRNKSSKHKRKRSRDRRSRSREKEERHRESKRDDRKGRGERDRKNVTSSTKKGSEVKATVKEVKPVVEKEETFSLIDKILKASEIIEKQPAYVEEAKKEQQKEIKESPKEMKVTTETIPDPPKKSMSVESDQEPSSTITIPTPPETAFEEDASEYQSPPSIWSGSINMVDVATFQISAFSVSGDCESVGKELPPALDIVGRISPETVWEYISKIKKSGNKEIIITQFKAETESEQAKYFALYSYLDTRKRLGVVKTASTSIKDFYISPLAAHKSLPTVLLPIKGVGFEDNRPDLLLGIIVMIKSGIKRVATTQVSSKHSKRIASAASTSSAKVVATGDNTPPTSPNSQITLKSKGLNESRKKLMMILPKQGVKDKVVAKASKVSVLPQGPNPDDDEPYSPGGSDEDIPILPATTSAVATGLDADDIQRKMDELNRQIGAKKMEIAGILNKGQDNVDEPYSPSRPVTPPVIPAAIPSLANISIPSNLSEILASIKNVSGSGSTAPTAAAAIPATAKNPPQISTMDVDDDEEYTPMAPLSSATAFQGVDYKPATGYKVDNSGPSKLAQLSEEELLSMVPDDAILEDIKASKSSEVTGVSKEEEPYEPSSKKSKWEESSEPPPPGLEDEYEPE